MTLRVLLVLIILNIQVNSYQYRGKDEWMDSCTYAGKHSIPYCRYILGFKSYWRQNSISWWPEQTKNMTFLELKKHCDDYFVCMENTGCYKDFVNYQELDKCIDDAFEMGPMSYCETTLRNIMKETPDKLSPCVMEYYKNKNPDKFDCLSIYEKGQCFLPDVEKHCEKSLLPIFKEHQTLRLYNRACDGRLRYKDWDYTKSQDYALQFTPGGVKIADPKRRILKHEDVEDNDTVNDGTNSTVL